MKGLVRGGLLCCYASAALAQYQFDVWNTDNGLPQNSVSSIVQTKDGYIWFVTFGGLVRYDGVRFTVLDAANSPGLRSSRLTSLFEDGAGTLWVATEEGAGLAAYRDGRFRTYSTSDGLPDNTVRRMRSDESGNLLIETRKGLARFSGGRFVAYEGDFGYPVAPGVVWHRKEDTLCRVAGGRAEPCISMKGLPSGGPSQFFEDRDGELWGSVGRKALFRRHQGTWIVYASPFSPQSLVRSIGQDREGGIWIGSSRGEVARFDGVRFTSERLMEDFGEFAVGAMLSDREGGFWVATHGGLFRLRDQFIETVGKPEGLPSDVVYALMEDSQKRLWIGGYPGLSILENNRVSPFDPSDPRGPGPGWISALYEDRSGGFWIGTYTGALIHMDHGKKTRWTSQDLGLGGNGIGPQAFLETKDGTMWIGTRTGLVRYDGKTFRRYTQADGLAANDVRSLLEDRKGGLWVGTGRGATLYAGGVFRRFGEAEGFPAAQVRDIHEDVRGVLWFGTYDRGLVRFENGKFTKYSKSQGLFNDGVFAILEDNDANLWMSCNQGIYRVSRRELDDYATGKKKEIGWVAYGKREGMRNVECNGGSQRSAIRGFDGRLWFATQGGAVVIDPRRVPHNQQRPPVAIEEVLLEHEPAKFQGGVRIPPGKSDLEIHYTAVSFVQPERVRFKYLMEGLDEDWVDARARRVAYYPHVPAGTYRFRVMAANADGIWNPDPAELTVVVVPPFWRTAWFGGLMACVFGAAAGAVYKRRVAALERARAAQESFSRQLLAYQESEQKRIAAELHDGLGQNLLLIKNRAVLGGIREDGNPKQRFEEISDMASRAIEEVREIAYNLRPHQLDELGVTDAIRSTITRIAESSQIHFTVDLDRIDGMFPKEIEISLYRIVQESVNNILKHSCATEARLTIRRTESTVELRVEDNGRGFEAGKRQGMGPGLGLKGITERARLIGANCTIQSAPGEGTKVTVVATTRPDWIRGGRKRRRA